MIDADEHELAAALVVAIEAGLLTIAEAIQVVDREILNRPSPGRWLIDASLIGTPQDLLHILRHVAHGQPLRHELWQLLGAMPSSLSRGADAFTRDRVIS